MTTIKLMAKIRNNIMEAKQMDGKYYCFVKRIGRWQRIAKKYIFTL